MNLEMPNSNFDKKINYLSEIENIKNNNEFLSDIAERFLERPDLLKLVKAFRDKELSAYGKNSMDSSVEKYKIKGITINPKNEDSELLIHELVHFYSMPALESAIQHKLKGSQTIPSFLKYLNDLGKLMHFAKKNGYSIINSYSKQDTIEEFAVNFTNKESAAELKKIGIYDYMVNSFFEMYNSLRIR